MNEPKQKTRIITIAGRPGSGKSTTAKAVAAQLGFRHFSSGDLFRALGKERGIDVLQTNLRGEKNPEIDHLVDQRLRNIGKNEDQIVIDSRTAWHWIPLSFKVFLDLDLETAAQRILQGLKEREAGNENIPHDPVEYAQVLQRRLESESRRYKSLYGIDPYDKSNYDLVIDTAANNVEQVIDLVTQGFRDRLKQ